MLKFRFRFRINFYNAPPYVGSYAYADRKSCKEACLALIEYINETRSEIVRNWTYHGWVDGEAEPEWRN